MLKAHFYILNNMEDVKPYIDTHISSIKEKYARMTKKQLLNEHNKNFLTWFQNEVVNDDAASDTFKWLASRPSFDVITWSGYYINNLSFSTKGRDDKSVVQNNEVMVVAVSNIYFCFLNRYMDDQVNNCTSKNVELPSTHSISKRVRSSTRLPACFFLCPPMWTFLATPLMLERPAGSR